VQINIRAPIFSPTGYAEWSRNIIDSLISMGHTILLNPADSPSTSSFLPSDIYDGYVSLIHSFDPQVPTLNIGVPSGYDFYVGRPRVALTLTEGLRLPKQWPVLLNTMDKIITVSEFGRRVFINSGVLSEKLSIIPPMVDSDRFHPEVPPLYCDSIRPFVILFVGQLILRKGWDKLLLGASLAFSKVNDVCILLKTAPIRDIEGVKQELAPYRAQSKIPILLHANTIPFENVPNLYQVPRNVLSNRLYTHLSEPEVRGVFALPSLGEGIGLPYLEAMSSGLLTCGTMVSGQSSFLNSSNSIIIKNRPASRNMAIETQLQLYRNNPFYDVTPDDIASALWRAYTMGTEERKRITVQARKDSEAYTFERCARSILEVIS